MKHIITISSIDDYAYIHLDGKDFGGGDHCAELIEALLRALTSIGEESYKLEAEEFYSWKEYGEKYPEEVINDDDEEDYYE